MKSIFFSAALIGISLVLIGCGVTSKPLVSENGNSGAADVLGGIISNITSRTNESTIVGTWVYQEPAVQMESNNLLASAASGIANKQIESKLESSYKTMGITKGSFTITFNSDKSCTYVIKGKESKGTYEFDSSTNKISIKSNGLLSLPSAYAKVSGSSLELTFETTALMNIAQSLASSSGNATLGTLSTLSKNYSGMKTGFHFEKK